MKSRSKKEPFHLRTRKKNTRATFVGEPINFRGMIYAPINEQGVIVLFGKIHDEIGIKIEAVRTTFPDATVRRFIGRAWVSERIEFKFRSSDFIQHGHDPDKADIIVCWINDWPGCPLQVIELKAIITITQLSLISFPIQSQTTFIQICQPNQQAHQSPTQLII